MEVKIERVGKLALTVKENVGEKFYCLDDILIQTNRAFCALDKIQKPVKLDCNIIFGYRFTGEHFIQSVFVDQDGLDKLCG